MRHGATSSQHSHSTGRGASLAGVLGVGAMLALAFLLASGLLSDRHPLFQTGTGADLSEPAPKAEPDAGDASSSLDPAMAPAMAPAGPQPGAPPRLGEAFIERFDAAALSERWFVSDGWSNGAWTENDWRASQVRVGPHGAEVILANAPEGSSKAMMSGEFRTRAAYRYGYFEVRMRIPRGSGQVTGAFTYAGADENGRPNEIDIELIGRDPRRIELTYHVGGKARGKRLTLPFDASEGFHTYAFEWRPDSIRWFADGQLLHEARDPAVARLTKPQQLIVSQWASRTLKKWVGPLDAAQAPWTLDVACIAYAPAYDGRNLCAGDGVHAPMRTAMTDAPYSTMR